MPSTATITAYYTFVAGTKARAGQVNTNFSNHRGHNIPIDPNTAAGANNTYDLGSTEYQWRNLYLKNAPIINGANTAKIYINNVYDGSVPTDVVEPLGFLDRVAFTADRDTSVRFQFSVPDEYTPGNRISLTVRGYIETDGASAIELETVAALYRPSTTAANLTVPSNLFTSTSDITPPTTTGVLFSNTSLRLTTSQGLINSITVTAGDLITVDLKRRATATSDTNSGYYFLNDVIVDLNN